MLNTARDVVMRTGQAPHAHVKINNRDDKDIGFQPDIITSLNGASSLMGNRKVCLSPNQVNHPFESLFYSSSDGAMHPFESLSWTPEQGTPPDLFKTPAENISSILQQADPPKGKAFPELLYEMLEDLEASDETHIASWQPHGRCFRVHRRQDFINHVIPRYFELTKWRSFLRQLNIYNFHRIQEDDGIDAGSYYHKLFLRGRPLLSKAITRQVATKGNKQDRASRSGPPVAPNFYAMPFMVFGEKEACSRTMKEELFIVPYLGYGAQGFPPDGAQDLPPDDFQGVKEVFTSMGKPFSLDDLDNLPEDDGLGQILD